MRSDQIPDAIIEHLAKIEKQPVDRQALAQYNVSRTRKTHMGLIRRYLDVRSFVITLGLLPFYEGILTVTLIGWSLKPRLTSYIVIAWFRRRLPAGVIHRSDRGSQNASKVFQSKLKEFGMVCCMSHKGISWENAPTESWFNRFKNDRYHGILYLTHDVMKAASFEYIEVFYN